MGDQLFKYPGPDGIIPTSLQNATESVLAVLKDSFKACLMFCFVPRLGKEETVTYILRAGKPSRTLPKDYRSSSPSLFHMKTLER